MNKDFLTDECLDEQMPSVFEELEVRRALNRGRLEEPDVNAEWAKFRRGLEIEEDSYIEDEQEDESTDHRKLFFSFIAGVAAAILVILLLFPFGKGSSSVEVFTANKNEKDIVMTSDEGEMTVVKNTKNLAFNQTPSQVTTLFRKVKMMEISTPRGKDCELTLPDGSKVWLNADSKISFPERFVGQERNVKIEGEAYFEVTKDAERPFVVTTDYLTTTVHGTVFNVNAYSAKTASVTLLNGSVAVKPTNGKEQLITPGQTAQCDAQGGLHVSEVDTYPLTQWKEGFFYFNNERLLDIMMELGRWYNVSVVFEHEEDMNLRLHFVAEHKESLRDILKRINDLGVVKVSMEKDHVSVE